MSLLNDALRSAEQRSEQPSAPAAYPGQTATGSSQTNTFVAILIAVAVVATLAAFILLWLWLKPDPEQMEAPLGAPFATSEVTRPERVFEDVAADKEPGSPGEHAERSIDTIEMKSKQPEVAEAEMVRAPELTPETEPEPDVAAAQLRPRKSESESEPASPASIAPSQPSSAPSPVTEENGSNTAVRGTTNSSGGDSDKEVSNVQAPMEPAPAIKRQQETPELMDRRTEKLIRQALSAGQFRKAEGMLADILAIQPAPQSRARLARHLLVNERPEQALTWLSREAANNDDLLRLLRARALLASGQSKEAVALLESNVPGVRQNAEYTVTLATLLQQQDRANDAAGRWAELIAYDDAKAAWWVGLAIALEADQQFRAATRAFEQAMLLPDLPPSLATYVRSRLIELGAG